MPRNILLLLLGRRRCWQGHTDLHDHPGGMNFDGAGGSARNREFAGVRRIGDGHVLNADLDVDPGLGCLRWGLEADHRGGRVEISAEGPGLSFYRSTGVGRRKLDDDIPASDAFDPHQQCSLGRRL